ncbi:MAG: cysteine hydrolase family protein [Gemmatimonadota bacterium]
MEKHAPRRRIGWIVDVQNDFMRPPEEGGRLYVHDLFDDVDPGAVEVEIRIERAVEWMREHCDILVYTGDWHSRDDEEIDPDDPDPERGTYPPHCMGLSDDPAEREGAQIIESIRPEEPLVLERDASREEAERIARTALREKRPIFIHKNRFDVFEGNPGAGPLLETLIAELGGDPEIVVCGVSRDVCVTQAIDAMQARGYRTVALKDATWGLGLEPEEETLARWAAGGRVTTVDALSHEEMRAP